jgi:Dyp-type peroxidase family
MNVRHVREVPAPEPLQCGFVDATRPDVGPNLGDREEPVLQIDQIQGSIIGGFNKDHRMLMFLTIADGEEENFRRWLKTQVPFIATAAEVLTYNRLFKHTKTRRGREGTVKSTWVNIAFSFSALSRLTADADLFTDAAFRQGLAARSATLGDPTDGSPGDQSNWLIGGESHEADVVFIVEADDRADMLAEVSRIENSLVTSKDADNEPLTGFADIIFKDEGSNLPPPLSGHEHFGFLDGVSQPGIRGRISEAPHDVLTLRQNHTNPGQGKPGQDLLWPGEFVFGYQKQNPHADEIDEPGGPVAKAGPEWADNGSFLVFRRLRQDVGAFHLFLRETAKSLGVPDPPNSTAARLVGAKLVGRWPSGAPVEREPGQENPALADDDCANNYFEFQEETGKLPALPPSDPKFSRFNCVDDNPDFPQAEEDTAGLRCPFTGHIRKAYPRDDESINTGSDMDKEDCNDSRAILGEVDTQTHRLLRRGLPYGPVSRSTPETPFDDDIDRGLQFLSYQTSIVNQFEFVTNCWVNNADFKEPSGDDTVNANLRGGHDPIIGQNPHKGRIREFTVTIPDPENPDEAMAHRVSTAEFAGKTGKTDWVIPTGGGYFFAPSLSALDEVLSSPAVQEDPVEMPEGAGESEAPATPAAS